MSRVDIGMRTARLLGTAALGLAMACSSPTAPPVPDAWVSATQVSYPTAPQEFGASATGAAVYLDGSIATPYWCYGFDATARRRNGEILVTLYAGQSSEGCITVGGWWNYRITIPSVPPGTWRIRVRHAFLPSTDAETVFETSVSVPADS